MKTKEEPEWYHSGQRPDEAKLIKAVRLYDSGWTLNELGENIIVQKAIYGNGLISLHQK